MRTALCIALLAVLASGCGSGGGNLAATQFHSAPNVPVMSGYIHGPPAGPVVVPSTGSLIWVGDHSNNHAEYGYYRFNISAIPGGSVIVEAYFRVGQELISGSPYANLGGQVMVDHLDLGAALDPADYTSPAMFTAGVAVLSTDPGITQKSANVTAAVQADVNAGRPRTDLRLRFPTGSDGDGFYDDTAFNNQANNGGSGLLPLLEIRYRAP